MSILDNFEEWKISAIPQYITEVDNGSGTWEPITVDQTAINGVKYNRSAAERYFSQSWQSDVSDVFVTDTPIELTEDDFLLIDGLQYAIDSIVNVEEQDCVWTIGLRIKK